MAEQGACVIENVEQVLALRNSDTSWNTNSDTFWNTNANAISYKEKKEQWLRSASSKSLEELHVAGETLVRFVRQSRDHTPIQYDFCLVGAFLLLIVIVFQPRPPITPFSLLLLACYLGSFTSYTLITCPWKYPLFLAIVCFVPMIQTEPRRFILIGSFLLLSLLPGSFVLNGVATVLLLGVSPSSVVVPQMVAEMAAILVPSSVIPARLACVFHWLALAGVSRQERERSSVAICLLFIGKEHAFSLLCFWEVLQLLVWDFVFVMMNSDDGMIGGMVSQSIHEESNESVDDSSLKNAINHSPHDAINPPSSSLRETIGILSLTLHFTYLVTPSFSFSSLRWASAFILTHSTHTLPQAYSMVLSVFYAYYLLPQVISPLWTQEVLRLQVLVVIVSTLYNTASPVIWSVFTPFLLFVLVMQSVYTLSSLSVHHNRPSPIAPILKLKAFLKSI